MTYELTAENVRRVVSDCLFTDSEIIDGMPPEDAIIVEGIVSNYGFHADRLDASKAAIASMLDGLYPVFRSDGGGGMSFLEACWNRNGEQWAEHRTMADLFALGMAAGMVSYNLPRKAWPVLPGGVPYLTIDAEALDAHLVDAIRPTP